MLCCVLLDSLERSSHFLPSHIVRVWFMFGVITGTCRNTCVHGHVLVIGLGLVVKNHIQGLLHVVFFLRSHLVFSGECVFDLVANALLPFSMFESMFQLGRSRRGNMYLLFHCKTKAFRNIFHHLIFFFRGVFSVVMTRNISRRFCLFCR